MARGVNKVILLGNLGADPEVRYTNNDMAIARLRLATSSSWRDRNTNEKHDKTEWHIVVAFGKLAEICKEYMSKGSQIYVEGRIQTNKWQTKEGQDRYTTEIIANEITMVGGKGSDTGSRAGQGGDSYEREYAAQPATSGREQPDTPPAAPEREEPSSAGSDGKRDSGFDDDIPF